MSYLRIQATLIVDEADTATIDPVRTFIENRRAKFRTLAGRTGDLEPSLFTVHRCYHDEAQPRPCEELYRLGG